MSIRQTYLVTEGEQMNEKQRQKVTEGESGVRMGKAQKEKQARKPLHSSKAVSFMSMVVAVLKHAERKWGRNFILF